MRSMATARMSSSVSLSSISRPLTIAPTGLITSWHTLEHKSAAKSSGAIVTVVKRPILWSMLMRSAGSGSVHQILVALYPIRGLLATYSGRRAMKGSHFIVGEGTLR